MKLVPYILFVVYTVQDYNGKLLIKLIKYEKYAALCSAFTLTHNLHLLYVV